LSLIGRDLTKILIIDNMPQNFRLQKENGIFIKSFFGEDQDDTALLELIPILTGILFVYHFSYCKQ
jgi:CTD small phosphatase-like protein 2